MSSIEASALSLLHFYIDSGVNAVLGKEPVNHLAQEMTQKSLPISPARAAEHTPVVSAGEATVSSLLSPDDAVMAARKAAAQALSLEELRTLMQEFEGCLLKKTATQMVFSDGTSGSRIMLVGEAPGRDEDREGKPFVGRSGQLLDKMLAAIGLDRSNVYIANIVPWRPPGNRTPTSQESEICLPFIKRQIELSQPDYLICLGGPSAQTLLGIREGILKSRGRWMPYKMADREIEALATLHPAYLLRQPAQKKLVWRDLLSLKEKLRAE